MFDDEKQPGDELEEIAREDQARGDRRPRRPAETTQDVAGGLGTFIHSTPKEAQPL